MKIISKDYDSSVKDSRTLPFSDVVKKSTNKFPAKISAKIAHHKEHSPKLFVAALLVIFGIFIGLIAGFLWVQSQGATVANVYRSKTSSYLEKVYNTSTIDTENPLDTAEAISKIEAPVLNGVFMGWLSYRYLEAELLQNNIATNVAKLTSVASENGEFYSFYAEYVSISDEIAAKSTDARSTDASKKLATYESIKIQYQNLATLVSDAKLPGELVSSQNKMKDDLAQIAAAWQGMIENISGDRSKFASNSYRYSLLVDSLGGSFSEVKKYSESIKSKLAQAAADFDKFRLSLQ